LTLKDLRTSKHLTQQSVATTVGGITQGAVWQWENGLAFPHPSKIPKLSELYGVSEGEIIAACEQARALKQSSA